MADRTSPKISIIVPVYRAEEYLENCIESILGQSYADFELLLVDDGSLDRSGAMCDTYSEKDTRIQTIHKENGGVSSARNVGLDHARGEYVVFVDSDDYLKEDYLSELYAKRLGFDEAEDTLVISDYQPFSPNGIEARSFPESFTVSLGGETSDAEAFRRLIFEFRLFPPYCKLYSRKVIEKHRLRFNENLRSAEDFDFNCRYVRQMKRVCYIPSVQYNYRVDYKKYRPSNDGILGQSEILSAHIMANGIKEIAERMGVANEVLPEICRWAANKHYFNRLGMLFAPNERIGFRTRKRLYNELIADEVYYGLAKKGVEYLPTSGTKRVAQTADRFSAWWMLYRFRELRSARK